MPDEFAFIAALRAIATHPAAAGLTDDTAQLDLPAGRLILTSDTMVAGVHFRPHDPPDAIGWKLAAVNLSDLAAKGAKPIGCLLNYALSGEAAWDHSFLAGLNEALVHYRMPLLGGDTVAMPQGSARSFTLTALGGGQASTPLRSGAQPGDGLWVTGRIGGAGFSPDGEPHDLARYLRPTPRLSEGQAIAPFATAMMDVSDGLLIDARRLAETSGVAIAIDLDAIPLALPDLDPIAAATAGDDYELLFTLPNGTNPPAPATRVGDVGVGSGLHLRRARRSVPLPASLGYCHGA
ncbi:thiamine-phosphate kinase [Sphingomonas turrisvirgatae]|uniref:Thiamine-monophosphate kinase n=1 Tax=Sphingomonas turrisvirgatae TaxID=1888892 RepID=A0A1E3LS85_9SPHN|nr:thiamine-phosphate kinase [Sphingomonas turrisvirgatae]ODP36609.1 thiamine-phosphate kinase [Sphingomonas turrisvirgatae]